MVNTRLLRGIIILLLTIGFTTYCIHNSFRKGRLSNVPNYDDVTYFSSATDMLESWRQGGLNGFEKFFTRDGLHSPYSIFLAAIAYSVGGYHDVVPYAANAILIAGYLCCIAYFIQEVSLLNSTLLFCLFLMFPFVEMAVVEFRPDPAWTIVTSFAAVYAVTRKDFFERRGPPLFFGALVGMSLFIKPSTFVMTIIVGGGAFGSRWLLEIYKNDFKPAALSLLRSIPLTLPLLILVAAPYYFFHGRDTWNYFMENSFGRNASVWVNPGDRWSQWTFYITGQGGTSNLNRPPVFTLVAMLGVFAFYMARTSVLKRLQVIFLLIITLMVYFVNTIAAMKSPFLGGAIYGLLFFTLAYVLGDVFSEIQKSPVETGGRSYPPVLGKKTLTILLSIATLWIILNDPFPAYSRWTREKRNISFLNANMMAEKYLATTSAPKNILFTHSGPVIFEGIKIWYLRRGFHPNSRSAAFYTLDEFKQVIKTEDMVLTQDKQTPGASFNLPAEALEDDFTSILKNDSAFYLAKTIPVVDGKNIYLFQRKQ